MRPRCMIIDSLIVSSLTCMEMKADNMLESVKVIGEHS